MRGPKYFVFSGGGVKGIAYGGALEVLEWIGALRDARGFAGASAGAATAMLLALGYSATEITDLYMTQNIRESIGQVKLTNLFQNQGIGMLDGTRVLEWLRERVAEKQGDPNLTFEQLWKRRGVVLVVVGSNLNRERAVYFSHRTHPSMRIAEAVRISMSVPLLFVAPVYQGDHYVDGGMLNNFPLNVFPREETLGLRLVTDYDAHLNYRKPIDNPLDLLSQLFWMTVNNQSTHLWRGANVVELAIGDAGSLEFDISETKKVELYQRGRAGMVRFLEQMAIRK